MPRARPGGGSTIPLLLGFSMILVVVSVISLHSSGGINAAIDPTARQKLKLFNDRAAAEIWLHSERAADMSGYIPGQSIKSTCPAFSTYADEVVPCHPDPSLLSTPVTIVTDHFRSSFSKFIVPHYDDLGEWSVSLRQPYLWNIKVSRPSSLEALYCASKWLAMNKLFDSSSYGYLRSSTVAEIDAVSKDLTSRFSFDSANFTKLITLLLTHQSAWLEGLRTTVPVVSDFITGGGAGDKAKGPDQEAMYAFARGLRLAFRELLPRPISTWSFDTIQAVQAEICRAMRQAYPLGFPRKGPQTIAYGQDAPSALGFEVPYLIQAYEAWLHRTAKTNCSHPLQFALDAYSNLIHIHPFIDCNTRTASTVMNVILLQYGYPPLFMLHPKTFSGIVPLRNSSFLGVKQPLYNVFLEQLLASANLLKVTNAVPAAVAEQLLSPTEQSTEKYRATHRA